MQSMVRTTVISGSSTNLRWEAQYIIIKSIGSPFFYQTHKNHITMSSEDFEMAPMVTDFKSFEEKAAEKFNQLASLNVNDKTESKNGLTYLSWSNAWMEFKKVYPTATYNIVKNPQTGLPYFVDPAVGIMVFTEVEAGGMKYSMWMPIMDSSNRAMKTEPYTYQVWKKPQSSMKTARSKLLQPRTSIVEL